LSYKEQPTYIQAEADYFAHELLNPDIYCVNIEEKINGINDLEYSKLIIDALLHAIAERRQLLCDEAEKLADGKCRGYQKSFHNDEPATMCETCKQNIFYEE